MMPWAVAQVRALPQANEFALLDCRNPGASSCVCYKIANTLFCYNGFFTGKLFDSVFADSKA